MVLHCIASYLALQYKITCCGMLCCYDKACATVLYTCFTILLWYDISYNDILYCVVLLLAPAWRFPKVLQYVVLCYDMLRYLSLYYTVLYYIV